MSAQIQSTLLSAHRFMELPEVTSITTLKKTAIYKLIQLGEITPVKIGRKTVFIESEIRHWVATRIAEHCKSVGALK